MSNLKTKAFILTLMVTLAFCSTALAQSSTPPPPQEPLVLIDEQGQYPLGRHVDILEDPSGELTITDVTSPEYSSSFVPSLQDVPNYGYTDSVFWLRLPLRNETSLTSQWLLEVNFPNLNYVDLYLLSADGGYSLKQSGALRPFDTRDIPYYHVVFNLPLPVQDEGTFYIRVESGSSMTLAFMLWAPQAFAVNKINDMLGIGLFYGALLIMLGYHLFAYYRLKEINYLYFILVLASSILFWATYEGIADQVLWPGLSQNKLPLLATTMSLFFMSTLKFSDVFLEQKTRVPRFHHMFNLFIGLWGLTIVIVPFSSYGLIAQIDSILILLTPAFAALAGFYNWRKGYQPARFYLISWLGYILGLMTLQLVRLGILPSTVFTEKAYHVGLIWLVLMWSFALADRINSLKAETEDVNRKLRQSQSQLSQTLEGLPIGVTVYNSQRKPSYLNQRGAEILANPERGILPDIKAGRTFPEAMDYFSFHVTGSDQDYPLEGMPIWQAFEGKSTSIDDIEADLVDRRIPLEIWANPVVDEHGNVESVVAAFQDISQRKQLDAELEQHRLHLEQLVAERTAQLSAANKQLHAENAERRRLEDMLRLRLEWLVVVNQVYQTIAHTSDLLPAYQKFIGPIKNLFNSAGAFLAELEMEKKELRLLSHSNQDGADHDLAGSVIPLPSTALSGVSLKQGKPVYIYRDQFGTLAGPLGAHLSSTDSQTVALVPFYSIENIIGLLGLEFLDAERAFSPDEISLLERIHLDIAQIREKAVLSEQTQALIAIEERNRLARDLHDSVTQVLFAANLVAEVLPQIWRRNPAAAQDSLEELRRLTRGALADMRTMLLELRPSSLIKTPLGELLAQLTEAITSRTGLPFQLFIEQIPPLPEDAHVGFYHIAQEGLNNIVKHAQASQVSVSLSATPLVTDPAEAWRGEVRLMIRDDGRGFTMHEAGSQGLGLAIMRERAAAIHADLSVESQPSHGTTVILTWHN